MTNKSDEKLAALAIDTALAAGASQAESYLGRSNSTSVDVSDGKTENVKVRDGSGLGVRVLMGERLGFAYTSDLSESGIAQVAKEAVANAESSSPDPHNRLPERSSQYPDIERFDSKLAGVGLDERIDRAMAMEASARDFDTRITKVRQSSVSDSTFETTLANSKGMALWQRGTSCSASILAVGEAKGDAQMGWDFDHSFVFANLDVESVGRLAAERAVALLGATQLESAEVPVILDSPVAGELLAAVGHALMADQVQKGKSLFADKLAQKVANENVTVIDDGAFEDGIAVSPADGEGVASQKTILIESGVLKGFLHNTYTADKGGAASTGNGIRASYASTPEVGASNFYLVPGPIDRSELINGCSRAFLVTDAMGMHTVDMVSGDFSVAASGLWMEGGEAKFPVRETTIAGNVKDLLVDIEAVANDLRFYGRYGSPTILVGKIAVSGK